MDPNQIDYNSYIYGDSADTVQSQAPPGYQWNGSQYVPIGSTATAAPVSPVNPGGDTFAAGTPQANGQTPAFIPDANQPAPSMPTGTAGQSVTTPAGQTVNYDTGGYIMGSTANPNGTVTIPNPATGVTSTVNTPAGTVAQSQNAPGQNPFVASSTPTKPAPAAPTAPTGNTTPQPTIPDSITSNATAPGPSASISSDPMLNTLYSQLLSEAMQSTNINPYTDPTISALVNAYGTQAQRAATQYQQGQAEAAGPYGSGSVDLTGREIAENLGASTAAYQAQATQTELTARRDQIQQALTSMGSLLTGEQQMALQNQLAQINSQIALLGLKQGGAQFSQNLGLAYDLPYLNYIYGTTPGATA